MTKERIAIIEKTATTLAIGVLSGGGNARAMQKAVDRYLTTHWHLDPDEWVWTLKTPWRGYMLTAWKVEDVSVTLALRSAVERLADLSDTP